MNQRKRTTATVRRLDATYTASFVPPMLSLAGTIPDAMKVVYGTFVERYPDIRPDALRALNTNVLAEVGVSTNLLDDRTSRSYYELIRSAFARSTCGMIRRCVSSSIAF